MELDLAQFQSSSQIAARAAAGRLRVVIADRGTGVGHTHQEGRRPALCIGPWGLGGRPGARHHRRQCGTALYLLRQMWQWNVQANAGNYDDTISA